jgi:hypothetical protein
VPSKKKYSACKNRLPTDTPLTLFWILANLFSSKVRIPMDRDHERISTLIRTSVSAFAGTTDRARGGFAFGA